MLRVGAKNAKGTHGWSLLNLMLRLSNIEKVKLVSLTHKGLFFSLYTVHSRTLISPSPDSVYHDHFELIVLLEGSF